MRPPGLKTRIFLDGGNPSETREIISLLGFLDGQTTNPKFSEDWNSLVKLEEARR